MGQMRAVLAIAGFLAAAGAVWWVFGSNRPPEPAPRGVSKPPAPAAPSRVQVGATPPEAPGLGPRPAPPEPPSRGPDGAIREFGSLRVRFVDGEGKPVPVEPRIDIAPSRGGTDLPAYPLPLRQEDGTWLYERLPVSAYVVRAAVPGFLLASGEGKVARDAETVVELALLPGGEVAYRVRFDEEEHSPTVAVTLATEAGRRIPAAIQGPAGVRFPPASAPPADVFPDPLEGRLLGLEPGTYVLTVRSPSGALAQQTFEAKVGHAADVEVRLPR